MHLLDGIRYTWMLSYQGLFYSSGELFGAFLMSTCDICSLSRSNKNKNCMHPILSGMTYVLSGDVIRIKIVGSPSYLE